jgi:hypothetical protein
MRALKKKLMQSRGSRLIWLAGALAPMTAKHFCTVAAAH